VNEAPTVVLYIAGSAIAFEATGEILETVDFNEDGSPDWSSAGICDYRGMGGAEGLALLQTALLAAERNAELGGFSVKRVSREIFLHGR